jgi:maleylpyruvate isomerase
MKAFDRMDDRAWATRVHTSQGKLPASAFVIDRLNEVVIHHVDLQTGFDFTDVDPQLVRTLLQWNLFRTSSRFSTIKLQVISDEGFSAVVGNGSPLTVRGNETNILGWLTGRKDSSSVLGADDLDLAGPV